MDHMAAKTQARLKWEVACERLTFALQPPAGAPDEGGPDLESAIGLAQAALEEIRQAFTVAAGGRVDEEA